MVFYDFANESQYPHWDVRLRGDTTVGGTTVVGMQDLVNASRSIGARQIIVLEPGSASYEAGSNAENGGWTIFPATDAIVQNSQQQDAKWGPILNHYPLFYGEWAFLTNASGGGINGSAICSGISQHQASQAMNNFLNYMASHNANWVAWSFEPYLLTDYKNLRTNDAECTLELW
jgi:hypothetical protein